MTAYRYDIVDKDNNRVRTFAFEVEDGTSTERVDTMMVQHVKLKRDLWSRIEKGECRISRTTLRGGSVKEICEDAPEGVFDDTGGAHGTDESTTGDSG